MNNRCGSRKGSISYHWQYIEQPRMQRHMPWIPSQQLQQHQGATSQHRVGPMLMQRRGDSWQAGCDTHKDKQDALTFMNKMERGLTVLRKPCQSLRTPYALALCSPYS